MPIKNLLGKVGDNVSDKSSSDTTAYSFMTLLDLRVLPITKAKH